MLFMHIKESVQYYSKFLLKTMSQVNMQLYYEDAIRALNSLQSNAHYIKTHGNKEVFKDSGCIDHTRKFLERSGIPIEKASQLSVIHVAGTKGKGSTCAYTESILRRHGFKTGFFSSPHLLEVRERIRINGKPIEKQDFTKTFWDVFKAIQEKKDHEDDLPSYFMFMTVLMFHVFLKEKVDVAILEVGIGGEFDCTNILDNTPVCGITSLGIDHTNLLGENLESIAWHKAGIMKKGSKVFTVPQPCKAMQVLREKSQSRMSELIELDGKLKLAVKLDTLFPPTIFNLNASLAVALSEAWIDWKNAHLNHSHRIKFSSELAKKALEECFWPGRYEVRTDKNIRFFLDGAHTLESIEACTNWFEGMTKNSSNTKALMFNLTGQRPAKNLLLELRKCGFSHVLFVPNVAVSVNSPDTYLDKPLVNHVQKCEEYRQIWKECDETNNAKVEVYKSVAEAIKDLQKNNGTYDLLVTGSIHLIGAVLSLLNPDLQGTLTSNGNINNNCLR